MYTYYWVELLNFYWFSVVKSTNSWAGIVVIFWVCFHSAPTNEEFKCHTKFSTLHLAWWHICCELCCVPSVKFVSSLIFLFFLFDRKQQRNILIELRITKEGWGILPQKKTKQQEYKNNKLNGKNKKQTLFARPHWSYTLLANLVATH